MNAYTLAVSPEKSAALLAEMEYLYVAKDTSTKLKMTGPPSFCAKLCFSLMGKFNTITFPLQNSSICVCCTELQHRTVKVWKVKVKASSVKVMLHSLSVMS